MPDDPFENKEDKKDTKFKKGQSGNPGGRPKGSKNKLATLRQIQDRLAKGNKKAFNTVLNMMGDEKASESVRLKAALEWIGFGLKTRKAIVDQIDYEFEKKKAGEEVETESSQEESDVPSVPIISLVASD